MAAVSPYVLLSQLRSVVSNPPRELTEDHKLRDELEKAARSLAVSLEHPMTALTRLAIGRSAELAVLRASSDLGLLSFIAKDDTSKSFTDIQSNIKADGVLLIRILRFLASCDILTEVGEDGYAMAPAFKLLGDSTFLGHSLACTGLVDNIFAFVPEVLQSQGYKNPDDRHFGAVQKAYNAPGKDSWEVLAGLDRSTVFAFSQFLGKIAAESVKPYDVYPIHERLVNGFKNEADEYLWIDVGGGMGQFTISLKKKYPDLPGKLIVQEQEPVIGAAKSKGLDEDVDFMVYDYFKEQPLKGARAYYSRNCFHNCPDKQARILLEQFRDAMEPGYSRLLIQEIVLPERGAGRYEATADWLMLMGYNALERSAAQWKALFESTGLRIAKIYSKEGLNESVIEVEKAV